MTASTSQPTFRRLLPPHQWRSRRGILLSVWSVVAAVLLCLMILAAALLVDLLAQRGEVRIAAADTPQAVALLADTRHALPPDDAEVERSLDDTGLLPTVWRGRNAWWSPPLAGLFRGVRATQSNLGWLTLLIGAALLAGLLRVYAMSKIRMLAAQISMASASALRRSIHRQALRLGPSDLDGAEQQRALDLFTRIAADARRDLAGWLSGIVLLPLEFLLLAVILLAVDWRIALQCGIPLAVIVRVTLDERRRGADVRRKADAEADSDLRPLADGIRKTRLVRGFGMEDFEHRQFQTYLERYTDRMLHGRMGETWALRTARFFTVLLVLAIAFILALHTLSAQQPLALAAAGLIAAVLYSLYRLFDGLLAMRDARSRATLTADQVFRYLAETPEVSQAVGAKFLQPMANSIILEAVSYRRDGEVLLDRIDLRLPAKTTTALVSNEPLSAQAIASMLPRFIEPHSGRILFDSEDIAWATLESLRAETMFVSADDPFFTGTVMENLICGESRFTPQQAMEACKLAHAHKFIISLPSGYETQLGEHGELLTPGQSFRLGLARAVLRNPAVLVIEEPRTRMDDDSKALVDDAYARILKDHTVIFLPTRLSTVKLCQQVVFLSGGHVEAVGSYADLLRNCEGFRHWEYVNFSLLARTKG